MRPGFARVIDIGIIRVEKGQVVERYQTLINPGMSVPSFISGFTGIRDADLVSAPEFEEVALEIERLLKDAVFVAHNAAFDYGFMKAEFARIGMEWGAETLCSVQLSRTLFPKERSHSLDAVITRHSIRILERHRALPDAEAVLQFMQKVNASVKPETLRRAVAKVRSGTISSAEEYNFVQLLDTGGDIESVIV